MGTSVWAVPVSHAPLRRRRDAVRELDVGRKDRKAVVASPIFGGARCFRHGLFALIAVDVCGPICYG
jgi:hypothetical protein